MILVSPRKVMGGGFGGIRSVGKPRSRWKNAGRDGIEFLRIRKWKESARNREKGGGGEIGKAMAR
jgi:hypothetical protein